ncbi:divalent-cation tolerance protein CutA [Saccharothrix violaceirubra]|uniref:Periplasmic divalent cation tolerance protein n=1 Tax=Saccharothrix violaceirubra TaxID=413306 RepID=A0A7W7WW70_9PSEU|nr:divalent-cation tolerance protein CutA [Saccharothrix violaceirubra]MBB4965806.1 periplasmic divalent cation tolerance protein [Saccharothrix violaceirubra]
MTEFVQVTTAAGSREAAFVLARSAVGARLAAGAQVVGPVGSVFWHLGELGEGEEWAVVLKTTTDRFPGLRDHLVANHPWTNPEVTATAVVDGTPEYFEWLRRTVAPDA